MDPLRVLVTGAGSAVGQGVIKSLRLSSLNLNILSADISPLNAALYRTQESLLIPKVESPDALPKIIAILQKQKIDVVMIGSEFDLNFFSINRKKIEEQTKAKVIVSPHETVEISNDKWLTAEFLRKQGLPYAQSQVPESELDALKIAESWGYPIILKPRSGTSARHVYVVKSPEQLKNWYGQVPSPVLQKMISAPTANLSNEYTCSVFKCADGEILGPFTARRSLSGGHSRVVEVDCFSELHPLLIAIGKNLNIMGTLNVQLMIGPGGPVPFEFNARFSGTTAVRAHFGFNEPEMSIQNFILNEKIAVPRITKGMAFRYDEEVFVNGLTAKDLSEPFKPGEVRTWF